MDVAPVIKSLVMMMMMISRLPIVSKIKLLPNIIVKQYSIAFKKFTL